VDQDRHVQLAGPGPQRIQAGVVHGDEVAGGVPVAQAELLKDLEPTGPRLYLALQLLGHAPAKIGSRIFKVGRGEVDQALAQHSLERAQALPEGNAPPLQGAHVHHTVQAIGLHDIQQKGRCIWMDVNMGIDYGTGAR
jgi:hypothetical protein